MDGLFRAGGFFHQRNYSDFAFYSDDVTQRQPGAGQKIHDEFTFFRIFGKLFDHVGDGAVEQIELDGPLVQAALVYPEFGVSRQHEFPFLLRQRALKFGHRVPFHGSDMRYRVYAGWVEFLSIATCAESPSSAPLDAILKKIRRILMSTDTVSYSLRCLHEKTTRVSALLS